MRTQRAVKAKCNLLRVSFFCFCYYCLLKWNEWRCTGKTKSGSHFVGQVEGGVAGQKGMHGSTKSENQLHLARLHQDVTSLDRRWCET